MIEVEFLSICCGRGSGVDQKRLNGKTLTRRLPEFAG